MKKLFLILLTLVLAFGIVACNDTPKTPDAGNNPSSGSDSGNNDSSEEIVEIGFGEVLPPSENNLVTLTQEKEEELNSYFGKILEAFDSNDIEDTKVYHTNITYKLTNATTVSITLHSNGDTVPENISVSGEGSIKAETNDSYEKMTLNGTLSLDNIKYEFIDFVAIHNEDNTYTADSGKLLVNEVLFEGTDISAEFYKFGPILRGYEFVKASEEYSSKQVQ